MLAGVFELHADEDADADGQSREPGRRRIERQVPVAQAWRWRGHFPTVCDQMIDSRIQLGTGRDLGEIASVLLQQDRETRVRVLVVCHEKPRCAIGGSL